jgi:3-oxoacyl-[acyl-carrier protein] reductase
VGGSASSVQGDVSSSSDVDRLFAEAKRLYGRIDIVVANSGVGAAPSPIASTTNDDYDRIMNVNLKGVFFTLRAAANHVTHSNYCTPLTNMSLC